MRVPARAALTRRGRGAPVRARQRLCAGGLGLHDRLQAAHSMMATACRRTFCGHVHVPAVFHMARGGRPAEFTPVPSVGIPLVASRQWLAVVA